MEQRLLTRTYPDNGIEQYGYGYYGASVPHLRTGLTLQQPTGNWTNGFTYDAARRLATVVSPAGAFAYTHQGPGNLVTNLALPNSSRITNGFDSGARLTSTSLRSSTNTLLNYHGYGYNLADQRTSQARFDASTVTYTYDDLGQLKKALGSGGQSTENLGYGYDAASNLSQRTNGAAVATFNVNSQNQLTNLQKNHWGQVWTWDISD